MMPAMLRAGTSLLSLGVSSSASSRAVCAPMLFWWSAGPHRQLERSLVGCTVVHRLAVRDDHVLERQPEELAECGARPLLVRRPQMRSSPPWLVNASAKTSARCSG